MVRCTRTQAAAALLLAFFACLVSSMPQRLQERPFVDQHREYFPDDRKFYFNYTFGDNSKRVFFRSNAEGTRGNNNNNNNRRPPAQHVSDIDGGYHYEKPKKRGPPAYKVHFNLFNDNNNVGGGGGY